VALEEIGERLAFCNFDIKRVGIWQDMIKKNRKRLLMRKLYVLQERVGNDICPYQEYQRDIDTLQFCIII
jgi:hypothetical protein